MFHTSSIYVVKVASTWILLYTWVGSRNIMTRLVVVVVVVVVVVTSSSKPTPSKSIVDFLILLCLPSGYEITDDLKVALEE